jgi:hypothetical protein
MDTAWDQIGSQRSSKEQRRALYRWLMGDRERLRALIQNANEEQAEQLLRILSQIAPKELPAVQVVEAEIEAATTEAPTK